MVLGSIQVGEAFLILDHPLVELAYSEKDYHIIALSVVTCNT